MAKYIDSEKAKQVLVDLHSQWIGRHFPFAGLISQSMIGGAFLMDAIPAADVAPMVHACWISRGGLFRCSRCDAKAPWRRQGGTGGWSWEFEQDKALYCPRCGARMSEEV